MGRTTPDLFITELAKLFASSHTNGKTVLITQKRVLPYRSSKSGGDAESSKPYCLVRAVHCARKVSALVGPDDMARFHPMYVTVLKTSTPGMKRAKKEKVKKASAPA
jgi:hypothetical protein